MSYALQRPMGEAAAILNNAKSFSLLLDLICSAIEPCFAGKPQLKYWKSLVAYIRELSADRNHIAHSQVMLILSDDGKSLGISSHRFVLTASSLLYLSDNVKREDIGAEEIREIELDFQHVIELAMDFLDEIGSSKALQEKWSKPIPRRRPPRSQRQAKGNR